MERTHQYVLRRPQLAAGSFRIDYAAALNSAQLEAVTTLEGPVLVVAGAGTGKTRTLVYRVARLVESGVPPGAILLLTFTRRAAQEMLRRAAALLDGRCEEVQGGTFHSFANLTLRRYGTAIGLAPNFTILDQGDMEDVLQLLRTQLGLDRRDRRFPRKGVLAEVLSMSVNKGLSIPELLQRDYPHLVEFREPITELAQRYRAYKRERHLVDYDDLLVLLCQLLAEHEDIRARLAERHRYLMVDEYQDTNALQAEIVWQLGQEHRNVMVVGDDAQSIYSFRGANVRNILEFPRLFPEARVIAIEENYRSTQPILDLANCMIARAREGYAKHLFCKRLGGQPPFLVPAPNENTQSLFVCQRILELREEGYELSDIAVLFRSAFHSFDLELELQRHDIPFVKRGGYRFMEAAHIKDVLAHLRLLVNPFDTVSWHRVLLLLPSVGPRIAQQIVEHAVAGIDPVAQLRSYPRPPLRARLEGLASLLERLPGLVHPQAMVDEVLTYYEPLLEQRYPDDYPRRRKDLEQFVALAANARSLEGFLTRMALEPPSDSVAGVLAAEKDEGCLTLSTIHSAKGLEWRVVFLIWAAEGRFPSPFSLDPDSLEEERRLMYVATTRAKELLYITYPVDVFDRSRGVILGKVSRLLEDLPPEVLPTLRLIREGQGSYPS